MLHTQHEHKEHNMSNMGRPFVKWCQLARKYLWQRSIGNAQLLMTKWRCDIGRAVCVGGRRFDFHVKRNVGDKHKCFPVSVCFLLIVLFVYRLLWD